jgi:acetoin utilization deacetylase AcuC-like enzyme
MSSSKLRQKPLVPLVYHPDYSYSFDAHHRFVMSKFERLYQYCMSQGWVDQNVFEPESAAISALSVAHDPAYLEALKTNSLDSKAMRRIGLPWSESLIHRTFISPNGTLATAQLALEHGIACHLAGGTHHAHYDFGSGFCLLNDLAYAALSLIASGAVARVLIFDCDVHQGDGTAAILQDNSDVFTCSIHCEKNFPFRKQHSDLDVGLQRFMSDREYLSVVDQTLVSLLEQFQPDIVLYDAGVDVWEGDALGHLNISLEGIYARDKLVIEQCLQRHIPIATVIGGGYDKDHAALAARHGIVVRAANSVYPSHRFEV